MLYTVENEQVRITVREHGAELRSITEKADGTEYLWNGDPVWWKYSSPVLFPIVGKLVDGKYRVDGKEYALPAHGLGRISDFTLVEQTVQSIVFALDWSMESLQCYPYKFRLEISYTLRGREIIVSWRVQNQDAKRMSFSIGAHPALLCPIVPGEKLEDCYLAFSHTEDAQQCRITPECLLTHEKVPGFQGTEMALRDGMFKDGVFIYDDLKSDTISIRSRKSKKSISVKAAGFTHWGIWSSEKGGAPFVCVEPWYGHADYADFHGDFSEKADSLRLEAGQEFHTSYSFLLG